MDVTLLSPHPTSQELWDTDVWFLHSQLVGTNVRLPKIHKIHPKLILSPYSHQQNLSLGINPTKMLSRVTHMTKLSGVVCVMNETNLANRLSHA